MGQAASRTLGVVPVCTMGVVSRGCILSHGRCLLCLTSSTSCRHRQPAICGRCCAWVCHADCVPGAAGQIYSPCVTSGEHSMQAHPGAQHRVCQGPLSRLATRHLVQLRHGDWVVGSTPPRIVCPERSAQSERLRARERYSDWDCGQCTLEDQSVVCRIWCVSMEHLASMAE
jgi:hypothetical protein